MKGKLLYNESQTFVGTWMWFLTLIMSLGISGLFIWGMYVQLILGTPWGDNPMNDTGLIAVGLSSILLMFGIFIFISTNRLTLQIDGKSIYVKFKPYFNEFKVFNQSDLQQVYVRRYKPILEYGGWGIRIGLKQNKAYNVTGNWGLQLVFADGKKLLIGTQQPKKLEQAIEKFKADG